MKNTVLAIHNFLKSDKHTLSVCGMMHSGKTDLLHKIKSDIQDKGKTYIVLSPNIRLAEIGAKSIYSHLYDAPVQSKENSDINNDTKSTKEKKRIKKMYS